MKKTKKSIKVPKPISTQKMWIIVGVALFLLIFFVIIYSSYKAGTGKAIEITEGQVIPMEANLITNDKLIFTSSYLESLSLNDKVQMRLNTSYTPGTIIYPLPSGLLFNLTITKIDDTLYSLAVRDPSVALNQVPPYSFWTRPIQKDVIDTSTSDSTFFYLRLNDLLPDLQISSQDGKIIVKNLHFISPVISTIEFKTIPGSDYPFIIRVPLGGLVRGTIKAGSSSLPAVTVTPGTLSGNVEDMTLNFTTANFDFTAPLTSAPQVLAITSTVGSQKTKAYYFLAINNVTFEQPGVRVLLTEPRTNKANITLILPSGTLQPLIMPCALTDNSVSGLLGNVKNSIVYSYDTSKKITALWHQNTSIPDDFTSFNVWQGYYVSVPTSITLQVACTVQELISNRDSPLSARPSMATKNLAAGWNLISLPGIVPQSLTSFTEDTEFKLYDCAQAACEKDKTTPLTPGKPYWVYTQNGLTLTYGLK